MIVQKFSRMRLFGIFVTLLVSGLTHASENITARMITLEGGGVLNFVIDLNEPKKDKVLWLSTRGSEVTDMRTLYQGQLISFPFQINEYRVALPSRVRANIYEGDKLPKTVSFLGKDANTFNAITHNGNLYQLPFSTALGSNPVFVEEFMHQGEYYLVLQIEDQLIEENQGTYVVRKKNGKLQKLSDELVDLSTVNLDSAVDGKGNLVLGDLSPLSLSSLSDAVVSEEASVEPALSKEELKRLEEFMKSFPDLVERARRQQNAVGDEPDAALIKQLGNYLGDGRSVVLLGDPGIGKTRQVKALAQAVARGEVRNLPENSEIRAVNMDALIAGAKHQGVFEERLRMLIDYAKSGKSRGKKIILFMDEFHSIAGQGTHEGKATDGLQSMKIELEEKELVILGTTNKDLYRRYIGHDKAITDRITEIEMEAPTGEKLLRTLRRWMAQEGYPEISDAMLNRVIDQSNRYMSVSSQPRKAARLIYEIYAPLAKDERVGVVVTDELINEALTRAVKVDPARFEPLVLNAKLDSTFKQLDSEFVGLDSQNKMARAVWKKNLSNITGSKKKGEALLYIGEPGVGKTSSARRTAELMGYHLGSVDLNRFAEGGINDLLIQIKEILDINPFSVIVFDELDKAPVKVQNALLQAIEDKKFSVTLETPTGNHKYTETVWLNHAIAYITANVPDSVVAAAMGNQNESGLKRRLGFDDGRGTNEESTQQEKNEMAERYQREARVRDAMVATGLFSEPLLSRLPNIGFFSRPTKEQFQSALSNKVRSMLEFVSKERGVQITLVNERAFVEYLGSVFQPGNDYRMVEAMVSNELEQYLIDIVNDPEFPKNGQVQITWNSPSTQKEKNLVAFTFGSECGDLLSSKGNKNKKR